MTKKKHYERNNQKHVITDFGTRAINKQNLSRTVVLPKIALKNCSDGVFKRVNVQLVQEKDEKYLKLTPVLSSKRILK